MRQLFSLAALTPLSLTASAALPCTQHNTTQHNTTHLISLKMYCIYCMRLVATCAEREKSTVLYVEVMCVYLIDIVSAGAVEAPVTVCP